MSKKSKAPVVCAICGGSARVYARKIAKHFHGIAPCNGSGMSANEASERRDYKLFLRGEVIKKMGEFYSLSF